MKRLPGILLFILLLSACSSEEEKHADDLDKAINQLETRIELQKRVIIEQDEAMEIIKENIEASKAEGMKDKYRNDLHMKELMKERAAAKVMNMDSILVKLKEKKDEE